MTFSIANTRLPKKTAILSHVLPPSPGGQCVVLSLLLEGVDSNDYVLITHSNTVTPERISRPLAARCYEVGQALKLDSRWRRALGPLAAGLSFVLNIVHRALQVGRVIHREKCRAIVACSGDPYNLAAAYLAARVLRVNLHPYLFDDPVYQWPSGRYRRFAQLFSPLMMRGAKTIIVPNEFLRDELRRRYSVDSVIVRNPAMVAATASPESSGARLLDATRAADSGAGGIVYTGVISYAHHDAFRNLVAALLLLRSGNGGDDPRLNLHVYSRTDDALLKAEGIEGPVIVHGQLRHGQIRAVQTAADVLFLPLGFATPIPELIRTSAPGKMAEYLASGQPILVHAPPDSFVAWYFRTYRCGLVVDEPSPERLAAAIRRLLDDVALRRELVSNAVTQAHDSFDVPVARAAFRRALDVGT